MKALIAAAMMLMNEQECQIVTPDQVFTNAVVRASVDLRIAPEEALVRVTMKALELRKSVIARTDMPLYCEAVRNHFAGK